MPEKALTRSPRGDVVPYLKQFLTLANDRWGTKESQRSVAQATGINYKTVSEWFNRTTKHYDLQRLGRFCWYFDTSSVLSYRPAAGTPPYPIPYASIGRVAPPADPPPTRTLIRNLIPEKLAGARVSEVVRKTGLSRNTVVALLNRERKLSRIGRRTLSALCDYLSEREGRPVEVSELLVFDREALLERERT